MLNCHRVSLRLIRFTKHVHCIIAKRPSNREMKQNVSTINKNATSVLPYSNAFVLGRFHPGLDLSVITIVPRMTADRVRHQMMNDSECLKPKLKEN